MNLPEFLTRDADGFIHVTGRRIGLMHLLYYYNDGYSPEMLLAEYPTLSLALIYKVIAFYLDNQAEVDAYLTHCRTEMEQQHAATPSGPSLVELRRRLEALSRTETH